MTLLACSCHFQPEGCFFGHFNHVCPGLTKVRHYIAVVVCKKFGRCLQKIIESVVIATFFIRHEDKAKCLRGRDFERHQSMSEKQGRDNALLIIFHATAIEQISLSANLPGITAPGIEITCTDNIHVAENPQGLLTLTGNATDDIGTQTRTDTVIDGIKTPAICDPKALQQLFKPCGLGKLAFSTVFRRQGARGG